MRALALALVLVAAVSYCEAATAQELVKMANEVDAPFTPEALKRLNSRELWGARRANSSVDAVIINTSDLTFKSITRTCSVGSQSPDLKSEDLVKPHTSTVFGVQSSKDDHELGCTQIYADPKSMDPDESPTTTFFRIVLDNTLSDSNFVYITPTSDLKVTQVVGQGRNNQAIIMVSSNRISRLSLQGAARVPPRKLKGSRNMFVKASKRGSSVRTI